MGLAGAHGSVIEEVEETVESDCKKPEWLYVSKTSIFEIEFHRG